MHGWHSRVLHTRRAVLFKIEAAVRIRETKTVTDVPAYWMMPANVEKVQAEVGYKIDFTSVQLRGLHLTSALVGRVGCQGYVLVLSL